MQKKLQSFNKSKAEREMWGGKRGSKELSVGAVLGFAACLPPQSLSYSPSQDLALLVTQEGSTH